MNQHAHPIHADQPVAGWYRKRLHKNGPWVPVYISPLRPGDKEMQAIVGDGKGGKTQVGAVEVWTWVASNPVDKKEARFAFDNGHWPGDIGIGDNSGDLSILDELGDALEQVRAFLRENVKVTSKTAADMAGNWRKRLVDLKSGADDARKAEKAPHLEKCREIDAKYAPNIDAAAALTNNLRRVLTSYLATEEEKVRAASPAATEVRVQVGGQSGKRIGLKAQTVYEIGNYAALLAAVADHPDVREAALKVAKARHKSGVEVPGLIARIEKVAS